jgi:integrase
MKLGGGKLPNDGLLFSTRDGSPLRPTTVSSIWGEIAASIGTPAITFHSLRHTHDASNDIVTISKRLGHVKASATLAIYAHMFHTDDGKAAEAINAALANDWVAFGWQSAFLFPSCSSEKIAKYLQSQGFAGLAQR